MKKLIAVVALYALAWGTVSFFYFDWTNAAAERGRHAIVLGEEHAWQLKAPAQLPPLPEACKDKLEPGSFASIASYIAKTEVKPKDDGNRWDEVLVGYRHSPRDDIVRETGFKTTEWHQAVLANLNPVDWAKHLEAAKAGSPELEAARYLIVARYFSLALPQNEGTDGYTRGGGDYSARVLTLPGGDVLCEGSGQVHMKETVNASGRGESKEAAQAEALDNAAKLVPFVFSLAVMTSPLHALCDAGGPGLCRLTGQWVGR